MPSLKYSFSGSALIFTKGSTTIDLLEGDIGVWLLIFYSTKLGLLLEDAEFNDSSLIVPKGLSKLSFSARPAGVTAV